VIVGQHAGETLRQPANFQGGRRGARGTVVHEGLVYSQ
jgi:hypothetical protein